MSFLSASDTEKQQISLEDIQAVRSRMLRGMVNVMALMAFLRP